MATAVEQSATSMSTSGSPVPDATPTVASASTVSPTNGKDNKTTGESKARQPASKAPSAATENERTILAKHFTEKLGKLEDLAAYMPLTQDNLFERFQDGVLLAYFVCLIKPVVQLNKLNRNIDQSALSNKKQKIYGSKHFLEAYENINAALKGVTMVGVKLVNVGSEDILNWNETIVLGLMWQVVRAELLQNISVSGHPELVRLLEDGESLLHLCQEGPEAILMRWVNYHIKKAGSDRTVTNWTSDLKDSECFLLVLSQIGKKLVDQESITEALKTSDLHKRAFAVVYNADRMGCAKFITANDIINCRAHINLAFLANLFNHFIGIRLPTEEEVDELHRVVARLKQILLDHGIGFDDDDRTTRALASSDRALAKLIARCETLEKQAAEDEAQYDTMAAMLKKANTLIVQLGEDRNKLSYANKGLLERQQAQNERVKDIISRLPKGFEVPPEVPMPPVYEAPIAPEILTIEVPMNKKDAAEAEKAQSPTTPSSKSKMATGGSSSAADAATTSSMPTPMPMEEVDDKPLPEMDDPLEHVEALLRSALTDDEVAKAIDSAQNVKVVSYEVDNPELLRQMVKKVVLDKRDLNKKVVAMQKQAIKDKATNDKMFAKVEQIATALNMSRKDKACGTCGKKCTTCK